MPVFALAPAAATAFWGAVSAGTMAGTQLYGAHKQSSANDRATDQAAAASQRQLEYLQAKDKSEAEERARVDAENKRRFDLAETTRREEYDKREARLTPYRAIGANATNTLSGMLGYGLNMSPYDAPAAPAPSSVAGAASAGSVDLSGAQAAFDALFPDATLTPDMVKGKEKELAAAGFTLRPNAAGVVGKVQYKGGPIIDVIQGAGSGLNRKQWLPPSASAPAAAATAVTTPSLAPRQSAPTTMNDLMLRTAPLAPTGSTPMRAFASRGY